MSKEDKPTKGNTSRKYKPRFVADKDQAPRGAVANTLGPQASGPSVSKSYKAIDVTVYVANEPEQSNEPDLTPEQEREAYLKDLPEATIFTSMTGDKEVDKHSMDRGEVPVTPEELQMVKESRQPQTEPSDTFNQSDFAKAFERAAERSEDLRQSQDRDKGPTLE